jgi:hypothetical protein
VRIITPCLKAVPQARRREWDRCQASGIR